MKTIQVSAAIIKNNNEFFVTQRGYGEFKGGWEFPGGKIELGETPEQALVREIQEELNTKIEVGELVSVVEYDYPNFHLKMYCFLCKILQGNLELREHQAAKWLEKEKLDTMDWLPADIELIRLLKK